MSDIIKAETSWSCLRCRKAGRKGARVVSEGGFYRHPTCKRTPAAEPQQCSEPKCTCGGDGGPEHELAIIGAFDDPVDEKGPWFGAMYDGLCSVNGCQIYEGDRIRADGYGGYECEDCGEVESMISTAVAGAAAGPDDWQAQASAAAKRHLEASPTDTPYVALLKDVIVTEVQDEVVIQLPTPETFLDPFDLPSKPAEAPRKINVSGQPEPNRDWQGRYIVKDPELGDFRWQKNGKAKGITRVTTFVKAAQDSKAINDWQKRNVVMGASLRPDVLRRAHGLTHENGKEQLDRIVGELDTAAGGKVSSEEGTFLHEETEYIDAGLKTWPESPPAYQQDLRRYVHALEEYGLEPVPGLIERTVMVREFGGVVGSFDRIFYHRASGQYVIGDLKTGKTLKWGMDEIQAQIWFYAHGVNQSGVYDWNTDTWRPVAHDAGVPNTMPPLVHVREDVGVIIHMPVQGPEAGAVYVRKADLVRGKAYAELCASVRDWEKSKVQDWGMPAAELLCAECGEAQDPNGHDCKPLSWAERFAAVTTKEEATALWLEAKADASVHPLTLQDFIRIARDALAGKG